MNHALKYTAINSLKIVFPTHFDETLSTIVYG